MTTDDETTVRRLLAAMGIAPPDDEVAEMVKSYPTLRAAADSLYTPEAARFLPAFVLNDADASGTNGVAR
jgi:hypothetical protein